MPPRLSSQLSCYLYPQLDPGVKTVRLLELLPADFSVLPIHCQLVERKLSPSLSYKALSYAWKNEDVAPDEAIYCNSKPIYISANLHAALRRFRQPDEVVSLWVDAVCINQQDDAERAYQVGMMRDIYQFSSEVLIWLGESGPDDDMGDWIWENVGTVGDDVRGTHDNPNVVQWFGNKDDIPKLKAYFSATSEDRALRFDDNRCDIFGTFCVFQLLASGVPVDKIWHLRHVSYSTSIINGLNAIMKKAWWRRIWVVQETVVAKSPMVYYGNVCMPLMCAPWRMFALAAVEYDTSRVKDNVDGLFSLLKSGQSLMQFTRVIMEIESTRRTWQKFEPLVPLTVLRKFRSRLATDPRDKVFAVLGLIRRWGLEKSGQATVGITPDYALRDYQIFFRTTWLLIKNTRSLAPLAGTLGSDGRSEMPSWVTDWNCSPSINEHIRLGNIQLYSAADYLCGSVALHGQSILEVQGYLLDKVDHVGRVLQNNQGRNRTRLTVLEWQKALPTLTGIVSGGYIAGGSLYAAFWRTLCSDLEFVQYADRSEYVREFRRLPGQMVRNEAFEHWLTVDESSRRRTSLIGGIWVEPTNSEMETQSKNAFQYLLECASGGRRFFRTRSGYIGTGPPDMKVGDSVAVLLGSQVPFILREDGRPRRCSGHDIDVLFSERASYKAGKGAKAEGVERFQCYVTHRHCHRVVGDAYVHGMMRGDARGANQWNDAPIFLV
ncbi:heterokaryon incompatibility protein-domain-containing protein [Xylaria bambusicola]|uniref:heterokaryon incompatibility protein-domain-containing protein n=1 Tax=Xylaria bambusicola TaxID=326684 RepID=UPI0020084FF1|nr:heterokaryon incompatibility protein-domain-containing protein [Xylaria bambusicola]KAI0522232.1 heterokaryon incompatibility protein-domain-containing protein [Xylaria bambusicola]